MTETGWAAGVLFAFGTRAFVSTTMTNVALPPVPTAPSVGVKPPYLDARQSDPFCIVALYHCTFRLRGAVLK